MTATLDNAVADLQRDNAELRQQLDACRSELAARNSEYGERIEHQSATIDVLKAMSASPGNPQPVFDMIVRRAQELCDGWGVTLCEFDGHLVHLSALCGKWEPSAVAAYRAAHPLVPTRASITCRAILDRQLVHIRDIDAEPQLLQVMRNIGWKSNLALPLLRNGVAIGAISLTSEIPGGFTDSQVALLQTFAEQAVIAITSAETYRELQQRTGDLQELLEYQTATSDVLKVISGSSFDIKPVFETIVETAARLCGADTATIYNREDDAYRAAATVSLTPEFDAWIRGRSFPASRGTVFGRAALQGRIVHVHDVASDPEYTMTEAITFETLRTILGVPLLREGVVVGVIALARQRVQPFTERQIELVRTFADQAVIALENARLLGELQARTRDLQELLEYQTATSDVLKVISRSTSDVQAVLDTVVETAFRLCGADSGAILIRDGEVYRYVSAPAADAEYWAILRQRTIVPGRDSVAGRVALEGIVVHVADILADPDYALPEVAAAGQRTMLGVPLLREIEPIGVIMLNRHRAEPFTERQIELVRTFADQAVIAMENARLLGELQARTRDLEESLEYQTATSDVLNVISRSTADVQPVLDTVVETAARLCGSEIAAIAIREGEVYRYVSMSTSAAEPEYWAILRQRRIVPGRDSVTARVALEGRVVHVADIRADPDYASPEALASGRRTQLGVPLLRDSEPIGIIMLSRKRVEPYTERQIELVRTFADQAVIAMENARLLGELQARTRDLEELLEYQTATSDVLNVISRSTADVQPVLDTVAETATRLCGADRGTILIREGEVYRYVASSISAAEPEFWASLRQRTIVPGRDTVAARVALEGRVVHVEDIRDIPDYAQPETVAAGTRTNLGVPLLRDGEPIGIIMLSRKRVEPYTERQIELVRTFADQAVIAMENARLLGELQARTRDLEESLEYQTATSDVLKVISRSTADVQPVLDTVAEIACRLCDSDTAAIFVRDGEVYRAVANNYVSAVDAELWADLRQRAFGPGRDTITGRVLLAGGVVHVEDILADPDYASPAAVAAGRRTILGVPLLREGAVLGTINLARKRVEPFTERQIELVRTFADQAVIAMENARLLGELQQRTGDLQESLEYQTATSDVLKVISRSTADVQPVLDTVVETAARLCDADSGIYHDTRGRDLPLWYRVRSVQRSPSYGRPCASEPWSPVATASPRGWRSKAGSCMSRTSSPTRTTRWPETVAAGRRTILGVPLLREGAVLGTINLTRKRVAAIHRAADRACPHLCRSGGHRDRERAAARRIAAAHRRIGRAQQRIRRAHRTSVRHDRRAQGDVGLTGRSAAGVRLDRPQGARSVQHRGRYLVRIRW